MDEQKQIPPTDIPGISALLRMRMTVTTDLKRDYNLDGWAPELDMAHKWTSWDIQARGSCSCGYIGDYFAHIKDVIRRHSLKPVDNPLTL